jgi:probable addiction module antidote protein
LTATLEDEHPSPQTKALSDIAKAREMSEIAKSSGVASEVLYKALKQDAHPRFETITGS